MAIENFNLGSVGLMQLDSLSYLRIRIFISLNYGSDAFNKILSKGE